MSSHQDQARFGQTLVNFSSKGVFPEEESISAASVEASALPSALAALEDAKAELERDIRQLSRESAPDVDAWIENAKSLQEDIEASRKLAVDVVQQAAADEHREETIKERQIYEDFLTKEVAFNAQLLSALRLIETVNNRLDNAEQLLDERKILEALRALEDVWNTITELPVERSTRAVRLLEQRSYELKAVAHNHLDTLWANLIDVDLKRRCVTINQSLPNVPGTLDEAVIALQAYKELDKAALKLSQSLSKTILLPRTDNTSKVLPGIEFSKNSIGLGKDSAELTLEALFRDLEAVIQFLKQSIPSDFISPLSREIMPDLVVRIRELWLDSAVPSSLDEMDDYSRSLEQVNAFAETLTSLGWPGADSFNDWAQGAPKIWLTKKREDALDQVRNGLSIGIRQPQMAQKVETRTVLDDNVPMTNQDWDAWGSDEELDPVAEFPSQDADPKIPTSNQPHQSGSEQSNENKESSLDEEVDDAWGWNDEEDIDLVKDEDAGVIPSTQLDVTSAPAQKSDNTREVTMTENYWTSSLPQPIVETIKEIYEDGARLLQPQNEKLPVAPVAAQLFAIPTLILALYRAVGPVFYSQNESGNLFLYNDSLWLSDGIKAFVSEWKSRNDLPSRAITLVRLDNEISTLESFGKRAYTNELNAQRTIIKDLLGGTHNFLQDEGSDHQELISRIETVVKHIRGRAKAWESILSSSALSSTLGALVNAVAIRLINDVFDMSSMSVTEAETAATVISIVEKLDDLFLPKGSHGKANGDSLSDQPIPLTFQYADQWMKMKFLSQTLQSNLTDINYMWFESDLSLYFTAQEVVELIELSFENNPGVRSQIRQIRESPHPRSID